jgi:preprotein translocase subunit SecA
MVSKAIERAQTTVEQKNAETRKNVLKYDEVMNEQRKVIYRRRDQILEGADLRAEALEYLAEAVDATISQHCVADFKEEWDLEGLAGTVNALWPNEISVEELDAAGSTDALYERIMGAATAYYEEREAEIGPEVMRQIERQVMLRIIDQRWREHLQEMDHLRDGIHLRAMGQRDPATEWQREGYAMFGQMMAGIAQDFVRYVMHARVQVQEPQAAPAITNVTESAPEGPVQSPMAAMRAAAAAAGGGGGGGGGGMDDAPAAAPAPAEAAPQKPIVKSEWEKTPRNAPCPCGSGKKFKLCHGAEG